MSVDEKPPLVLDPLEHDIVQMIRRREQQSRSDLALNLGGSRSTVAHTVNQLIKRGILKDVETGESTGGRRPRLLDLNDRFGYVLGIPMGATGASICIADFRGRIIDWCRQSFLIHDKPSSVMDKVFESVSDLLARHRLDREQIYGIGVGVPAPVDKNTGLIVSPATMLGWEHYSIADYCHQHFPHAVVCIDNDVNLMARGELRAGIGKNHTNFFFVKIGTGIGCGIVNNGEIYRGTNGCAGHIGHVSVDRNGPVCRCGNVGCLEKFAAGPAIAEQAMAAARENRSAILAELLEKRGGALLPEDVGKAAGRGDKIANDIIIESGRVIGEVLATLVSFFNPSLVIIGGGVSNIGPQFLISIHRTILEYSLPLSTRDCTIRRSEMGYHAGMEGAITLALDHVFVPAGQ